MGHKMKPISSIKARLGIEPNGRVQRFLTNTCYTHMDKYVPMDTGNLASNVDIQANSITYESPYAHYMYVGEVYGPNIPIIEDGIVVGWFSPKGKKKSPTGKAIKYHTDKHKNAGPYWDKRMVSAEINDVVNEVQNYIGGK